MDRSRRLGKLARGVSIIGVGMSKHGDVKTTAEIKGFTERELWHWAAREAMEDANCRPQDIQAQYIANTAGEYMTGSFHLDGHAPFSRARPHRPTFAGFDRGRGCWSERR